MVSRNTACEKNVVNLTRAVEDYVSSFPVSCYERLQPIFLLYSLVQEDIMFRVG